MLKFDLIIYYDVINDRYCINSQNIFIHTNFVKFNNKNRFFNKKLSQIINIEDIELKTKLYIELTKLNYNYIFRSMKQLGASCSSILRLMYLY